jgi:hypothetical protein
MTLTKIAAGNLMGGRLICVTNYEVRATTYPTAKPESLGLSMLTLAFLTTKGLQHIWQIKFDSMQKVTDVYLM